MSQLTKNGVVLLILLISAVANDCAKVVVLDLLLELVDPFAPLLLAGLALHGVLVDGGGGVEVGELLHEGLVDLVVHLGQAQLGALDLLEDGPVGHEVLDSCWVGELALVVVQEGRREVSLGVCSSGFKGKDLIPTFDCELLLHLLNWSAIQCSQASGAIRATHILQVLSLLGVKGLRHFGGFMKESSF